MKFLKWRDTWSWGNSEWVIELLSILENYDKELLDERIEYKNHNKSWSDKFRGIEYEVIDYPGHEWMLQNINQCKDKINNINKLLVEYNALYYKNGGNKIR